MTAHELAKKLLDGPDAPVFVYDGMDPSTLCPAGWLETTSTEDNCIQIKILAE